MKLWIWVLLVPVTILLWRLCCVLVGLVAGYIGTLHESGDADEKG